MKTMISAASLALLVVAGASPVLAQDWSGPYVGVYGGYLETGEDEDERLVFDRDFDGQFDDTVVLNGTTNSAFSPGSCDGAAVGATPGAGCSSDSNGVEGGIRAGWDWQLGNFVIGGVAEISAVKSEDSVTSFSTTPASYVLTTEIEHMAALRARLGYAFGPVLIYGTGGAAYAKVNNSFYTTNGANTFTATSDEDDADGYQAGAGMEWKLAPNLSLVGEYLYTSLEPDPYVVRVGPGTAPPANPFILPPNTAGTDLRRSNDNYDIHAFRIGMNVSF